MFANIFFFMVNFCLFSISVLFVKKFLFFSPLSSKFSSKSSVSELLSEITFRFESSFASQPFFLNFSFSGILYNLSSLAFTLSILSVFLFIGFFKFILH